MGHSLIIDVLGAVVWLGQSQFKNIFSQFYCAQQICVRKLLLHVGHRRTVFFKEVFAVTFDNNRHLQNTLGVRSSLRLNLQHGFYQLAHIHRVMGWDRRVLAFENSFKKTVHIVSSKWGHKGTHLINHAAE